jgi:ribose 5-phosphate isomerase B
MVRRVVYRTVGRAVPAAAQTRKSLITELDVHAVDADGELVVPEHSVITPLAYQVAMERKVKLVRGRSGAATDSASAGSGAAVADHRDQGEQVIAIGADHGGFELKESLKAFLAELGWAVVDCGTDSQESVDYPDFALAVGQLVAQGRARCGIVVDGAGIGSCMAANKVPGVRAALCYDQATAVNSREHNHANVLTLGAGLIGANLARQIVRAWLETPSGGGRHARRVDKIMDIERSFLKRG